MDLHGLAVGVAAGAALAGRVIDAHGASTAFAVPACAAAVAVAVAFLGSRRLRPAPEREVAGSDGHDPASSRTTGRPDGRAWRTGRAMSRLGRGERGAGLGGRAAAVLRRAAEDGLTAKAVGSGHSFTAAEKIMTGHGGRTHWGKVHTRDAQYLRSGCPRFADSPRCEPGWTRDACSVTTTCGGR